MKKNEKKSEKKKLKNLNGKKLNVGGKLKNQKNYIHKS